MDVAARLDLWRMIDGLRDSGTTILMNTHQQAEAEHLCTRVALMQRGRVMALGSVPELLARVPGQVVARLQSRDSTATVQCMRGWAGPRAKTRGA